MARLHPLLLALATLGALLIGAPTAEAVRLKDVAQVEGVRDNQLIGYGLVTGLRGTGDGIRTAFTAKSLAAMLAGMGISVDPDEVRVKNVAAVMVTATLPPFAQPGGRLDITVSSIGDARSLEGGTLLITPLKAANGRVYAVAQGALTLGGFNVEAAGSRTQQNHPTVARIPNGALVERPMGFSLDGQESIRFLLSKPDFTTASRAAEAINQTAQADIARAADGGTIEVAVEGEWRERIPELIASLERTEIEVDTRAKVILNERTGTVVMGANVRISTVAIAHGNLTIQIQNANQVSQPGPFAEGETVETQNATIATAVDSIGLSLVQGATIGEIVGALNALGVSPRDLIIILQSMQAAGALQAEIEVI